jgi:hypothetical protein
MHNPGRGGQSTARTGGRLSFLGGVHGVEEVLHRTWRRKAREADSMVWAATFMALAAFSMSSSTHGRGACTDREWPSAFSC